MSDRDEIISHLQIMHVWAAFALENDLYFFNEKHMKSIAEWTEEAIEQMKPVQAEYEGDSKSTWWYVCGECHTAIDSRDRFCRQCGRPIQWK